MKVVDIKKNYNFVIDKFSFEIIYRKKITFKFVTFEIRIFQTISDGETTKTKVIDLEKSYNFVIDNITLEFV
jgi:hypothetical protein